MKSIEEIMKIAGNCLNCKRPLCSIEGCPVNTNIPGFISAIKENNLAAAYYILQENNIMSDICSLVCPTENQCMGKCVKGIKGEPVKINELENFVNLWAKKNNIKCAINCDIKNNKKIAVIGAGPSGIACSIELAKKGFNVTIFEKEAELGGILRYGIPDFRLEKKLIDDLTEKIKSLNVNIKTSISFGRDITIEDLKKDNYEAIFLSIGATKSSTYKLSDNNSKIYNADDILKKYNNGILENLGKVVVIGGGNVAMDAARTCKKAGAKKVSILYRRDLESMPARRVEIEDTINDGIEIEYLTKVIGCTYEVENIKEITCTRTKMVDGRIIDIENSDFMLEVDNIIFAIGLYPDNELLEKNDLLLKNGLLEVDSNQMTNIPGVFAGGDLIDAKSSVCRAIKMGKVAAKNIEKYVIK